MSRRARDWAWSCRGLTLALRCILLALAEHADEEGRCWPSLTRLAALTEADRRTVTRGLAALEARALVARARRPGKGTVYTLAIGTSASTVTSQDVTDPRARGERPPDPGASDPRSQERETPGVGARDPWSRGERPPE
jgi:DNA-binding transcriptional ArsR family regulator